MSKPKGWMASVPKLAGAPLRRPPWQAVGHRPAPAPSSQGAHVSRGHAPPAREGSSWLRMAALSQNFNNLNM